MLPKLNTDFSLKGAARRASASGSSSPNEVKHEGKTGSNTFATGFLTGGVLSFTPFLLWAIAEDGMEGLLPAIIGVFVAPVVGIVTGIIWSFNPR